MVLDAGGHLILVTYFECGERLLVCSVRGTVLSVNVIECFSHMSARLLLRIYFGAAKPDESEVVPGTDDGKHSIATE